MDLMLPGHDSWEITRWLRADERLADIPVLGIIPDDEQLMRLESDGRPLVELGDDSPVYQAVAAMMRLIL